MLPLKVVCGFRVLVDHGLSWHLQRVTTLHLFDFMCE